MVAILQTFRLLAVFKAASPGDTTALSKEQRQPPLPKAGWPVSREEDQDHIS